jgi:Mg/Co/Ni transporter MgtE
LISGLVESQIDGGNFQSTVLDAFQDIFEDLLIDLAAAALAGAILRPVLSTPGFPSISQWSSVLVRGLGTNNRRQKDYQR